MLGYVRGTVNSRIWQEKERENKKYLDFTVGVLSIYLMNTFKNADISEYSFK